MTLAEAKERVSNRERMTAQEYIDFLNTVECFQLDDQTTLPRIMRNTRTSRFVQVNRAGLGSDYNDIHYEIERIDNNLVIHLDDERGRQRGRQDDLRNRLENIARECQFSRKSGHHWCSGSIQSCETQNPQVVIESIWQSLGDLYDAFEKTLEDFDAPAKAETPMDPTKFRMTTEIKNLLESNLQIILTGAPGTGKTYTAREVAKKMVGAIQPESPTDEDKENATKAEIERITFVQFHPGYDYSDFVIGMKPVLVSETGKEVFTDEYGHQYTTDSNRKDGIRTDFSDKTSVSFVWRDGIFKKFADKAKKDLDHKYVFLIDEINRSDLSRVFGELFSLLEEEYRYPNNKKGITLPNGETFVIPRNLYIIGTMNDIDRSVESMDFALRRRFAWKEVFAKDTRDDILGAVDEAGKRKIAEGDATNLKRAMDALNREIGGGEGATLDLRLGTAYQLGGAIFAKFEKCSGNFDALWNNHISNVLGEYLRGRRDREDILKKLKGIFDKAVGVRSGEQSSRQNADDNPAPIAQPETPQL